MGTDTRLKQESKDDDEEEDTRRARSSSLSCIRPRPASLSLHLPPYLPTFSTLSLLSLPLCLPSLPPCLPGVVPCLPPSLPPALPALPRRPSLWASRSL